MFMELGMKLDNLIERIKEWHRGMFWYKIYAYFFIRKKIKTKAFKDDKHFEHFMESLKYKGQIWEWQYKMFWKMYKEGHND